MTYTARKSNEQYQYEKALADAIVHEMPISLSDADKIDAGLIQEPICKRIISTFKSLYQIPSSQPNNKQLADCVYEDLYRLGFSDLDASKQADHIESLIGRKREPNISLVAEAIKRFSVVTTRPSYLHIVSEQDSPVAYEVLLQQCKKAEGQNLADHLDSIVGLFNASHAVVLHGGKTLICERTEDHKGMIEYRFSPVPQKRSFYDNLNFSHHVDDKLKSVNCFELWMKHHDRKTYHGVVFDPANRTDNRFLNMWTGFQFEPQEGDNLIEKILWHLKFIICSGNDEDYKYLLAWMAHIVQKPEQKSGVCVVLKSEARGTGKSTVSVLLERLLGQHAMRVQDGKHLLGAFNSHLANKLFVTIEEAFWSGSAKDAGKLRTLITESTVTIEAKGKDALEVDSFHRFMMCTNNDWAVPQTQDERRFFVLEVSEDKKQDKDYFVDLYDVVNSDDAMEQFFHFLKHYDLESYNLHKAPKTSAIQQQIIESLPSEAIWLKGVLDNGCLFEAFQNLDLECSQSIPKSYFFDDYIRYCDKMNVSSYERCNPIKLGAFLKKVAGVIDGGKATVNGQRFNCYRTLTLRQMEIRFEEHYNYR
ncbi:primase-helicase family protein [Vibrio breoganii]|uniref:DUF5906 domain-containing protein n=1 Tax=Vibrio breoganii TaxID=553239 RepID=UPI000C84BD3F|nr:DUF5906 domain-containing protein [Vibrio breoganii]PMK56791.1 hypothetical protein BCT98_09155 [Vibrio breoganii]